MILINLPVANVDRSRKFFSELGYQFNEDFCGTSSAAVVLGDNQFAMLTHTDLFDTLHPVETADATKAKECVICLSADSRDAVDSLVDRAISRGGTPGDTEDFDFMYGRSYNDLDGHAWQIFWMNPSAAG